MNERKQNLFILTISIIVASLIMLMSSCSDNNKISTPIPIEQSTDNNDIVNV
jgi:hypothetical protein